MNKTIKKYKKLYGNLDEHIDSLITINKKEFERAGKLLYKDFSPESFYNNKEWVITDWEDAQTIGFALAVYYDKIAEQYCDLKDYKNKK